MRLVLSDDQMLHGSHCDACFMLDEILQVEVEAHPRGEPCPGTWRGLHTLQERTSMKDLNEHCLIKASNTAPSSSGPSHQETRGEELGKTKTAAAGK